VWVGGSGLEVQGSGFRVQGLAFQRSPISYSHPYPNTPAPLFTPHSSLFTLLASGGSNLSKSNFISRLYQFTTFLISEI